MDFFARQERSRRTSRYLVVAFALAFATVALAAALVVAAAFSLYNGSAPLAATAGLGGWLRANAGLIALVGGVTLACMALASLYRTASLAGGGGKVARLLGGTEVPADVTDLPRRRLLNVVEEMAIASGLPVPDVYVLEQEAQINAFAAGTTPSDAAVAVTRGALERLDRAELQGVIAHELSHVLNGDMRLNQQLIALSFGILVMSLIGRGLLRATYFGGAARMGAARVGRRIRGRGAAGALAVGAALALIGAIGLFLSRVIKAAVSRERERLADASAVQFTREPSGLASALKKIGGYGARLNAVDDEEVGHMLFEHGAPGLGGWLATHPPLIERIRALEPGFDPRDYPRPEPAFGADPDPRAGGGPASTLAGAAAPPPPGESSAAAPGRNGAGDLVSRAGEIASPAVGAGLRAALPAALIDAAHSRDASMLLALAFALSDEPAARERQRGVLDARIGPRRAARCVELRDRLSRIDPKLRMPVLELALPALKQRPAEQLEYLFELVSRLVETGEATRLFDYVLLRMLAAHVTDAPDAALVPRPRRRLSAGAAGAALLAVVAAFGHERDDEALAAWRAGLAALDGKAARKTGPDDGVLRRDLAQLDAALARLSRLAPRAKRRVLEAVLATIRHDRHVGVEETELFRAIAAALGCPLPPTDDVVAPADDAPRQIESC